MTVDADTTPLPLPCARYPECRQECDWPECGIFNAIAQYLAATHGPYDVAAGLAQLRALLESARLEDPE